MKGRRFLLTIAAGLCAAAVAWIGSYLLPSSSFTGTMDVWFEGDLRRVFSNLVDRHGDHYRSKVHPLFSLIGYAMVWVPRKLLQIDPELSVRLAGALAALVWGVLLYRLLVLITDHDLGALLYFGMAISSASFLFWATVPETYIFGSLSMILALLLIPWVRRSRTLLAEVAMTAASALTLSFTVTNWMAGIAAAFCSLQWRRALQVTVNAFCAVVLLWGVQKYIFPSATFFIGDKEESDYMSRPDTKRFADVTRSFVFTSIVMAKPTFERRDYQPQRVMFTQRSIPGSGSWMGIVAGWLWPVVLGMAIRGVFRAGEVKALAIALVLTLFGQMLLHVIYGEETFLYSLHFAPLLVAFAAFGARTHDRVWAYATAGGLLILMSIHNWQQLLQAFAYAAHPS